MAKLPKIYELLRLRPIDKQREVGIEVEMEGHDLYRGEDRFWNVVGDGSLRGEGAEYVLSAPCLRNRVEARLNTLSAQLAKNNSTLEPSDRCGVHIHLNCQQNTFNEVINHIILYYIVEDLLLTYCGESREGNFYCLRTRDAGFLIENLIGCIRDSDIEQIANAEGVRYSSLNTTSLGKFGSLEFRSLRTPQHLSEIALWTELLLKVKDRALHYKEPRVMVEELSFKGPEVFAQEIFGERLLTVLKLTCPDIPSVLYEGVRRVQDAAYTIPIKNQTTKYDLEERGGGYRPRRRNRIAAPGWGAPNVGREQLDVLNAALGIEEPDEADGPC